MKSLKVFGLSLVFTLALVITASAQNVNVTGSTGADGTYATLGAAFTALNANVTQTGNVITVAIVGDTTEGATSAVLNQPSGGSWASLTISPTGTRIVSGATTAGTPMIDFNSADNVAINGGGTLTLTNTTASTTAGTGTVRYINDATGNSIQNTTILGAGAGAATGNIIFGNTTGSTGNDSNTVNGCNIGPAGAATYSNAILSAGSTTTQATRNSGLQITNNNIFDFFTNTAIIANGFLASAGTTDATITGNSFYQTATRTMSVAASGFIGISIADTSSINNNVSNNFIGGSAASAGGTAWTQTGAVTHTFIGIRMSIGTATPSSLQNNVIRNLSISTSSASTINAGISAVTGAMNIGTTTGNTIGATTGTGSVTWTGAGAGARFAAISAGTGTPGGINISNNNVGSVTIAGAGTTVFYGIRMEGSATAAYTVAGNTIGSTTTANSITSNSNTTFVGISSSNTGFPASVTGNTLQNLQHTSTGTSASLRGIELIGSVSNQNISTNTIRDFSSASTSTSANGTPAVGGIIFTGSATTGNTILGNTIRDLSNSAASAGVVNNGIVITSTPGTTITRNNIFNLTVATTSTAALIQGINLFNSAATINIYNNMMRLGTGVGNNPIIRGVFDNTATSSPTNIYFNSIFIDGTQGGNTVNTTGVVRSLASTMDIKDNIIWNNRASTGAPGAGTGRHYAIRNESATGTFTSNGNDLFTPNNGGTIGFSASLDRITLGNWQTATSQDLNSFNQDPQFIDATNATSPNLHIHPTNLTIIEGNGVALATPTDDFDGQVRASFTPVDIGADAGNFNGIDMAAPIITYTPFSNTTSTANRILVVTLTDNTGVATGGLAPRIYFNKNGGSFFSTQCVLATGTVNNGTWNCTIDYTPVGGVIVTDVIRYFVVAQDTIGNLASNPSAGFTGTDVNTVTPPTTPNQYTIVNGFGGSISVGTDQAVTSLTNPGGIFDLLNQGAITSNLNINLTTDLLAETGTIFLNQQAEEAPGGFTINIQASGAARIISGSNTTALITINGGDRVTFNGLGFGPYGITIRNTSATTGGVIRYLNDSSNNSILSCLVEQNNINNTAILYGTGAVTGNDNNAVTSSIVRGTNAATPPFNSIATIGTSAAISNGNLNVVDNQLTEFGQAAFLASTGTDNFNVTGNDISQNAARAANLFVVACAASSGAIVTGTNTLNNNRIHSITNSSTFATIGVLVANCGVLNVTNNRMWDFQTTAGATGVIEGIEYDGVSGGTPTLNVINNFISLAPTLTTAQAVIGIQDFAFGGNIFTANYNSVYIGGTASGATPSWAIKRGNLAPTTYTARNNIGFNARTGGTSSHFAGGDDSANTGTFVSDNNTWVGLGSTPANFMDYGTVSTGTPVTVAAWQAGPPARDAASTFFLSTAIAATDIYINPIGNDLHLFSNSTGGVLGGGAVVPVSTDIDGDPRPATAPDRGADELVQAQGGSIAAGTYYNAQVVVGNTLAGNVNITNALYVNGIFNTGANTISLGCDAGVNNADANNYIVGNLKKDFCTTGLFTFPVGTTPNGSARDGNSPEGTPSEYSPVAVTINPTTVFPSSLTVNVVDTWLPGLGNTSSTSRYWNVTETGDVNADMTFQYLPEDVYGTETSYKVFKYDGSFTTQYGPGTVNAGLNQFTAPGVTSFSGWAAGVNAVTAATANISGRVLTSGGMPIANVKMVLTGGELDGPMIVYTGSLGYYNFENLPVGQNYVVTVKSRRFFFSNPSQLHLLSDSIFDGDFVADPQ